MCVCKAKDKEGKAEMEKKRRKFPINSDPGQRKNHEGGKQKVTFSASNDFPSRAVLKIQKLSSSGGSLPSLQEKWEKQKLLYLNSNTASLRKWWEP